MDKEIFGHTVKEWIFLILIVITASVVVDHALDKEQIRVERHGY